MEGKKPVGNLVEKGKLFQMGKSGHHHVATLLLNLAHLFEPVGDTRFLEHFVPFGVLLHLFGRKGVKLGW